MRKWVDYIVVASFLILLAIGFKYAASGGGTYWTGSESKSSEPTEEQVAIRAADAFVDGLKRVQRNPDSFVIEKVFITLDYVCVTYRSQNGFGGMNRERALRNIDNPIITMLSNDQNFAENWNKKCAGKSGEDRTSRY